MTRRVYPLNSLRAFEASARHLSFVKAAEELYVTPAAISHQVKRLEEYLGVQLFRRLPRGLLLAETGQVLLSELREVFLRLDKAMERVLESDSRGALTISVAPMFAVKWLVPRLQRFDALNPDIDLRMSSSLGVIDFQRDAFDAGVRLGRGQYPGLAAVKLFEESVTPMCSPRLLENKNERRHDKIMEQVRAYLEGAPFDFRDASTIDAREEALYAWVAANYLNGSLATKTENGMIGILELGGASGQIAFVPQDLKPENTEVVHIAGIKYKVYAWGYDGVGKTKITKAFENEKLCFPTNYKMAGGRVGEGDHDECQGRIIEYLATTDQPAFRQLREDTRPEPNGRFLAISNFVFTPNVFGQENVMDYNELGISGSKYCSTEWEKIGEEYPNALEDYRSEYCLMAAYIPALLTHGFRVRERDEDNKHRVTLRLDGSKADVDWTLGALILLLH